MSWLIHVVCHELAHIKQMNHSPAFQKVNNEYRQQVRALQARGYFGDGQLQFASAVGSLLISAPCWQVYGRGHHVFLFKPVSVLEAESTGTVVTA